MSYNHVPRRRSLSKATALAAGFAVALSSAPTVSDAASPFHLYRPRLTKPERALEGIINGIKQGENATVTKDTLLLEGKDGSIDKGYPIAFKVGEKTYLAFLQAQDLKINQDTSASQLSTSMTILPEELPSGHSLALQDAYLGKNAVLVDTNRQPVGVAVPEKQ